MSFPSDSASRITSLMLVPPFADDDSALSGKAVPPVCFERQHCLKYFYLRYLRTADSEIWSCRYAMLPGLIPWYLHVFADNFPHQLLFLGRQHSGKPALGRGGLADALPDFRNPRFFFRVCEQFIPLFGGLASRSLRFCFRRSGSCLCHGFRLHRLPFGLLYGFQHRTLFRRCKLIFQIVCPAVQQNFLFSAEIQTEPEKRQGLRRARCPFRGSASAPPLHNGIGRSPTAKESTAPEP